MDSFNFCPKCKIAVSPEDFFCRNCGKPLKPRPLSTSIGKQTIIYLVSIFLPPFGLSPAVKYIKQPDSKSKIIGWVAVALTILSITITTLLFIKTIQDTFSVYKDLL